MSLEQRSEPGPDRRHERHVQRVQKSDGPEEFFGIDVEGLSPRAQAVTGLVVGGTILAGVVLVLALNPAFFWLIFIFGWLIFPAFGLFARGVAGLAEYRASPLPENGKERELLEALRSHGELSSAQAALETSLTVSEADDMLGALAEGGHLEVRVRGGGIFYALWDRDASSSGTGELEGR